MLSINNKKTIFWLTLLLLVVAFSSLAMGRYAIPISSIFNGLDDTSVRVLLKIRLPRILGAILIGFALSTAGASYQTLFKNPMASPSTLGASSGAAFGALLGIFFRFNYYGIIALSFTFGMISVLLALIIARRIKIDAILGLLLTGIVLGSLFQGLISFLKLIADPMKTLPEMTYWLFGSLSGISYDALLFSGIIVMISWLFLYSISFKLNVLSLGHDEAKSMGLSTQKITTLTVIFATLLTASSVAVAGLIGWVGLIIPHISRSICGHDLKRLIPTSSLLGASFLILVDSVSRTIYTSEIPMGILISFIGAPMFLWILIRRRSRFYD